MAGEYRSGEIRISLSYARAVEFLDKLQSDDNFREELRDHPRATLLDYGIDVSPETLPEPPLRLPSADQVAAFRDSVRDYESMFESAADHPLGYAILFMLGAMPVVVGRDAG